MNYLGHWIASTFQNNNLDYKNSRLKSEIEELEGIIKKLTKENKEKEKDYKKQIEELKEVNRRLTRELQRKELSKPVTIEPKTEEIVREIAEFKLPKPKPKLDSIRLFDYFGTKDYNYDKEREE